MSFFLRLSAVSLLLVGTSCTSAPHQARIAPPIPFCGCAPPPPPTYVVYFDWNRASLSQKSLHFISMAAAKAKSVSSYQIRVRGFADTSGPPPYNEILSHERALAVRKQLIVDGVSKAKIAVEYFGDTHLLVPTNPGVRESQNRRVEIVVEY